MYVHIICLSLSLSLSTSLSHTHRHIVFLFYYIAIRFYLLGLWRSFTIFLLSNNDTVQRVILFELNY